MVSYKANQLVICDQNYDTEEEFEDAIKTAILLLMKNEFIMTVQEEETGIVVIEYETEHMEWGANYPYWLSPEEYDVVLAYNKYMNE